MRSKKDLLNRWELSAGKAVVLAIEKGTSRNELYQLTAVLPFAEEVSSHIDLRGLKGVVFFKDLDLSNARFDYAEFLGSIYHCNCARAIFDHVNLDRLSLMSDFQGASFIEARLRGSFFKNANISQANFTKAKLRSALLQGANCENTNFTAADLTFANCFEANFTGADFTDANLTEATLGKVQFDQTTKLTRTVMSDIPGSNPFYVYARKAGAVFKKDTNDYELALFDGTAQELKRNNQDGHLDDVLEILKGFRSELTDNPNFDWGTELAQKIPPKLMEEVKSAYSEAGKKI